MRRFVAPITGLALVLTLIAAPLPATAQLTENLACPTDIITDAGFADVDPNNVHKADIDCVAYWGITSGTSPTTYDPKGTVTRWQMALFLTRTFDALVGLSVDGRDQGFADIGGLSGPAQTAINQLKQLSITAGTSPTTFSPYRPVNRSEMALFLTRLLTNDGVSLPDGSDQGFTDIAGLNAATQKAINQLKQLRITAGTSPTTFAPYGAVTREQIASFLVRALNADGSISALAWYTTDCDAQGNCTLNGTYPANTAIMHRWGWTYTPLPVTPADQGFYTSSHRVELTWNGNSVPMNEELIVVSDAAFKLYEAYFAGGLTGNHTFVIRWYWDNALDQTWTMNIQFTE